MHAHTTHEVKLRENLERASYAERLTHELAYSLSNLYHASMGGFECVATHGNKKCGLFSHHGTKSMGYVPI